MRHTILVGWLAVAAMAIVGGAAAEETKLRGTVGPGYTISLRDAQGSPVAHLPAGEAEIEVEDLGDEHNFHLTGPGVDVSTGVEGRATTTFRVTLRDGTYVFLCDPHPTRMTGSFTVGAVSQAPPPATTTTSSSPPESPRPTPSAPVGARLVLTTGPGLVITLKTAAGRRVTVLRPGAYTVVVRDRSPAHNARLRGAGANRATGIGTVGTQTWKLTLRKGVLTFECDPHRSTMRGTVTIA